jgi:tripartite-type tricarboxylate transporter receptor subunit TctC
MLPRKSGLKRLKRTWGQPIVADNKPATGIIGTEAVSRAAPDGHTLALVASSHAINPSTMKKLPFDTLKSFEPIVLTHMARMAWALLAHGGTPELAAAA